MQLVSPKKVDMDGENKFPYVILGSIASQIMIVMYHH